MDTKQPGFFYGRLKEQLEAVGISVNKISTLSGIPRNRFPEWGRNLRVPTVAEIEKLASVPELGLIKEQLEAWRAIEVYGVEALKAYYEEAKRLEPEKIERYTKARKQALGE